METVFYKRASLIFLCVCILTSSTSMNNYFHSLFLWLSISFTSQGVFLTFRKPVTFWDLLVPGRRATAASLCVAFRFLPYHSFLISVFTHILIFADYTRFQLLLKMNMTRPFFSLSLLLLDVFWEDKRTILIYTVMFMFVVQIDIFLII